MAGISIATIKKLFKRSGNVCAFPGCGVEEMLVICHIIGLRKDSARHDPLKSEKELNAYDNLILLCPNHHTLIDDIEPKKYPVEELKIMREEHEKKIHSLIKDGFQKVKAGFQKIWEILHPRNTSFTGRDDYLNALESALKKGESAVLTQQAIFGLGGIGKTQIATEYSYRNLSKYDVIWWVRSEKTASIASDFARLASDLGLPEKNNRDQSIVVKAVKKWLENHPRWLLVFDNVQTPEDIIEFIPHTGTGHVIVTSRHTEWECHNFKPVKIPIMNDDEAFKFLSDRTGIDNRESALNLAKKLGYLPLALEQAAAYINTQKMSYESYLDLFDKQRAIILKKGLKRKDYDETTATTWQISFDKLKKESEAGIELLNICAFLAPENIGKVLFILGKEYLPKKLAAIIEDEVSMNDVYEALSRYSLVELSENSFSIHRLVQAVIQDNLDAKEKKLYSQCAVSIINNVFPNESSDVRTWDICSLLMPHAIVVAMHAEEYGVYENSGRLLNQMGAYQLGRADYAGAKSNFERAIKVDEKAFGPDHPNVATVVNNLGEVLRKLGNFEGAKANYERALSIDEKAFGPDHPSVARDVNNLGEVLRNLGDYKGAKANFERALRIDEKAFGPDHPSVAIRVNNLGGVLKALGDYEGAKANYERALSIDEKAFGPDHPSVARDVNNLGEVLRNLGDYKGAKANYERALRIDEKAFGPDHPNVATYVNNLGGVLSELGDYEGAKANYERALRIDEKALGPDHPNVATLVNNLGGVLKALGDYEGAKVNYERALRIDEKAFGPDHPKVAIRVNNLGLVLQNLGDLHGAKNNMQRALEIFTKYFGANHPNTKVVKGNLDYVDKLIKSGKK